MMRQRQQVFRSRVGWSRWSVGLTVGILALGVALLFMVGADWKRLYLFVVFTALIIAGFYFAPMEIIVTPRYLGVRRLLTMKRIPIADIEGASLWQTTMADRRVVGSGGFMGHWGYYRSRDLGPYFAYVGSYADTFLVTLRSGRRYLLSCADPAAAVAAINAALLARRP